MNFKDTERQQCLDSRISLCNAFKAFLCLLLFSFAQQVRNVHSSNTRMVRALLSYPPLKVTLSVSPLCSCPGTRTKGSSTALPWAGTRGVLDHWAKSCLPLHCSLPLAFCQSMKRCYGLDISPFPGFFLLHCHAHPQHTPLWAESLRCPDCIPRPPISLSNVS